MKESEVERARLVVDALKSLPPDTLAVAAAQAPPELAAALTKLRDALAGEHPEAAVAGILGVGAADEDSLRALVAKVAGDLRSTSADVARGTALGRDQLDDLRKSQDELLNLLGGSRDAIAAEPLRDLVDRVLELARQDEPAASLLTALSSTQEAAAALTALADQVTRAPEKAAPAELRGLLDKLRAGHAQLRAATERFDDLVPLVGSLRAWADARMTPTERAQLAAVEAALRHSRNAEDPELRRCLREALDAACEARLLPLARAVAQRLTLMALHAGELSDVAAYAAQIAELAQRLGDVDAEVGALGEQALALAKQGGQLRTARALADRAAALANGTGDALQAVRARLLLAQVAELTGDTAAARQGFRKVMDHGAQDRRCGDEVGWAALHLGRLERGRGHLRQARDDLDLAHRLARHVGDLPLFVQAASARVDLAADEDDAPRALAALHDLRDVDATRGGLDLAIRELEARIDRRWPGAGAR